MKTQNILLLLVVSVMLSGCGSSPQKKTQRTSNQIISPSAQVQGTPEQLLAQARQLDAPGKYDKLLELAELYQEQACEKSIVITELLSSEDLLLEQSQRNHLLWAECLVSEGKLSEAKALLPLIGDAAFTLNRKANLEYNINRAEENWWDAAQHLAKIADGNREDDDEIWQLLQNLALDEIAVHVKAASLIKPTMELLYLERAEGHRPEQFRQKVTTWQKRYPRHTFAQQLPSSIEQLLQTAAYAPQKIAVLLPLSGRLANQGNAVKEGILSAHFSSGLQGPELTFVDSQLWQNAPDTDFSEYDFVVGPLLKENIVRFQESVNALTPTLSLNFLDETEQSVSNDQYYFALSPEDEATQLAHHLTNLGHQKPVIIAATNNTTERMQKAFSAEWLKLHQTLPELITFTDNKNARKNVENILGVEQSKKQVRQIEALLTRELHAFERNRRDVDSIVVFANPIQTELINPVIESSIAPFAKILPVFASSRSHSKNLNQNSLRDLRNLTFVDMPWMLPGNQFNYLKETSQQLWPKRRDGTLRLFAMGFDAYQIIPHLRHLSLLPKNRFQGLSGAFYINEDKQLHRELSWGQVQQEKVILLAMD